MAEETNYRQAALDLLVSHLRREDGGTRKAAALTAIFRATTPDADDANEAAARQAALAAFLDLRERKDHVPGLPELAIAVLEIGGPEAAGESAETPALLRGIQTLLQTFEQELATLREAVELLHQDAKVILDRVPG